MAEVIQSKESQRIDGTIRPWEHAYQQDQASSAQPDFPYARVEDVLKKTVEKSPQRIGFSLALPSGDCLDVPYGKIDSESNKIAAYLQVELGLRPGDVVAIQMPNSVHFPILVFGALKAGLSVTNINPLYTAREAAHQIRDAGAKVLFGFNLFSERVAETVKETQLDQVILCAAWELFPRLTSAKLAFFMKTVKKLVPPAEFEHITFSKVLKLGAKRSKKYEPPALPSSDDVAFIQYTGGTTGRSKGAELTHRNILSSVNMLKQRVGNRLDGDEQPSILTVIPYYHIFALIVNMMFFTSYGGRNILIPNPNPISNLKPAFERYQINWLTGVDTLFSGLMSQPWFSEIAPKIDMTFGGGTAIKPVTSKKWSSTVGPIVEGYGMTETSGILSLSPLDGSYKPGSVGHPAPNIDVKIIDEAGHPVGFEEPGELLVKGPNITGGYLNNVEATEAAFKDGWLATGDIVKMDLDGTLWIVDRKKDMILVSGFNVFPNEIEAVIAELPGVSEVAVIGVKHPSRGESPRAFVVKSDDEETSESVLEHCRKHLTAYKIPTEVIFLDELPKSPVGKVLRNQLPTD